MSKVSAYSSLVTPTSGLELYAIDSSGNSRKIQLEDAFKLLGNAAPSSGAILTFSSATSTHAWSIPTSGSVLVGSSIGVPTWTAAGAAGYLLQSTGSVPAWKSPIKYISVQCFSSATALATGPVGYFHIPPELSGYNLTYVNGTHFSSAGSVGQTEIALINQTDNSSMLSSHCEISSGSICSTQSASQALINGAADDVADGDLLRVDLKVIPSASAPKGLAMTYGFSLP